MHAILADVDELLPGLTFGFGFLVVFGIWIKAQMEFFRKIRRLEEQYAREGIKYEYLKDFPTRLRMLDQNYSIDREGDSVEIKQLKLLVMQSRKRVTQSFKFCIVAGGVVMVLTIIVGIVAAAFK